MIKEKKLDCRMGFMIIIVRAEGFFRGDIKQGDVKVYKIYKFFVNIYLYIFLLNLGTGHATTT